MESFMNERKVQQGEDWNLDLLLSASNKEYVPYIVSSERHNPYFVVTVASTKYEKNTRYVKSWWQDLKDLPKFYGTTVIDYGSVQLDSDDDPILPTPLNWSGDPKNVDIVIEDEVKRYLYEYHINTNTERYYFYFDYTEDNQPSERIDTYECHVRFNFLSEDTKDWTGQNYIYQITLVSGELVNSAMDNIALSHSINHLDFPIDWPETAIDGEGNIEDTQPNKVKYVKAVWPKDIQPDIDSDSRLGTLETPQPILLPTKLDVFNNARQLI